MHNVSRTSIRVSKRFPRVASASLTIAVALAIVGLAHAATQTKHDLEHGAAEARSRAAEARADEQALAGDISVQSERIDAVESDIGGVTG